MTLPVPGALTTWDLLLRLGAATLVGAAFGLDREARHKPAGMRTLALVALGAAMIVVVVVENPNTGSTFDANAMSRVMQGILTGIGFIGAGVIMRTEREQTVHGLTTAATIWVVAALGITCGAGRWRIVGLAMVLALGTLFTGRFVENAMLRFFQRRDESSHDPPGKDE